MHKKLVELGFGRDKSRKSVVYKQQCELAPDKRLTVNWDMGDDDIVGVNPSFFS